jgi:hypothetical protein
MNVMLDEPGIRTAVQSRLEICTEVWWGKRLLTTQVDLDRIDPDRLAELLTDAWECKAPSNVVASTAAPRQEQERRT